MPSLTIVLLTNRLRPMWEWWIESLIRQLLPGDDVSFIIVDFHAEPCDQWTQEMVDVRRGELFALLDKHGLRHRTKYTPMMPNVWAGRHRLPKENHWAASDARNTALCLSEGLWTLFTDDLACFQPQFMECAREAMRLNRATICSYRKLTKMVVEDGLLKSFEKANLDTRLQFCTQDVSRCTGGWLYGGVLAKTKDFLGVGGYPSDLCGGLGGEDYCMGLAMQNAGVEFYYDRRFVWDESDELHAQGPVFKKQDKGPPGTEDDKSHKALRIAEKTRHFRNVNDINEARAIVLSGGSWPIPMEPSADWFDGTPLKDA